MGIMGFLNKSKINSLYGLYNKEPVKHEKFTLDMSKFGGTYDANVIPAEEMMSGDILMKGRHKSMVEALERHKGEKVLVRDLDELAENYNSEAVMRYFGTGKLYIWLKDRYYEDEAAQVCALKKRGKDVSAFNLSDVPEGCITFNKTDYSWWWSEFDSTHVYFNKAYLDTELKIIFGIIKREDVDPEAIKINEKRERLRKYTENEEILNNAADTAFSQEELAELLDKGTNPIYLCGEKFRIPMSVKSQKYVGVNIPVITVGGSGGISFSDNGIIIKYCKISDDVLDRLSEEESELYNE